jgi:hypothetical protein
VAVVILGNQSICSRTGSENKMEGFPPKIMWLILPSLKQENSVH